MIAFVVVSRLKCSAIFWSGT